MISPTPPPTCPCVRIKRVAETSSESRKSVAIKSAGAKAANSSGSPIVMASSSTMPEPTMLIASRASSTIGGNGTTKMPTIDRTIAAKA